MMTPAPPKPVQLTLDELRLMQRLKQLRNAARPTRLVIEIDERGLRWWVAAKSEG